MNVPRSNNFLSQALYPMLNALFLAANIHQAKSTKELQDHFHVMEILPFFKGLESQQRILP